jgi:(Z)-2-((N-methylformamido)methylene)-5-hydroxybutyrolactone dehydrogenase
MNGGMEMKIYDKLFIGGEWVKSQSEKMMDVINPATEEIWARVPEGSKEDVDRAVRAARDAFNGPWRKISTYERSALLRKMGDLMKENVDFLASLETRENGKPLHISTKENSIFSQWWYYYAGLADKIHGETIPFEDSKHIFTLREPLGVVGSITPWNTPIQLIVWKLSVALAAGNTVVLKPAETTPVTAMEIAKLSEQAGFPPGVINVVTGYGNVVGERLTSHLDVDKITFTGYGDTARKIMKSASTNIKKLSFELGGKSPNIIFPDANLDKALNTAVESSFILTGQSCALSSRLLVHIDIYDEFINKFKEKAKQIKVGDPNEQVDIGPHAHKQQLEKTLNYIQIGQEEGAELVLGGDRPNHLEKGYFINPTIFVNVKPEMRIAQEEIFGPVVCVIPFSSEEEAVEIANSVTYGLTAAVWTKDLAKAHRMAKAIQSGTVWVNTYRYVRWVTPYGGYKQSGVGKENGVEAIKDFTQVKTVVIDLED